jgi:hypothetical protein
MDCGPLGALLGNSIGRGRNARLASRLHLGVGQFGLRQVEIEAGELAKSISYRLLARNTGQPHALGCELAIAASHLQRTRHGFLHLGGFLRPSASFQRLAPVASWKDAVRPLPDTMRSIHLQRLAAPLPHPYRALAARTACPLSGGPHVRKHRSRT